MEFDCEKFEFYSEILFANESWSGKRPTRKEGQEIRDEGVESISRGRRRRTDVRNFVRIDRKTREICKRNFHESQEVSADRGSVLS